jgi:hypothetical protein
VHKWLALIDTSFTDAGLKHLAGLNKLERVDLEGSRVTDSGVAALEQVLPSARIYH